MGNNPSTEKPHRAPQKLSKPRIGNHTSNGINTLTHRLNATRSNVTVDDQRPTSHTSGLPSSLPYEVAETPQIAVQGVSDELGNAEVANVENEGPITRGSKRLSGLIRSVSSKSQPERGSSAQDVGDAAVKSFEGVVRPKSLVQARTKSLAPTTQLRPVSSQDPGRGEVAANEQSPRPENLQAAESPDPHMAGQQIASSEPMPYRRQYSHPEQNSSDRGFPSERVPYITRRSSFGQTPGAATRVSPQEPQRVSKSSFRNSLPVAPSTVNVTAPRTELVRRQSMPVSSGITNEVQRAATPSDGDYRQLGGMKFGSLRITNDHPAPTNEDFVPREDAQWPLLPMNGRYEGVSQHSQDVTPVPDTVNTGASDTSTLQSHHSDDPLSPPAIALVSSPIEKRPDEHNLPLDTALVHDSAVMDPIDQLSVEHDSTRERAGSQSNADSGYASNSPSGSLSEKVSDDVPSIDNPEGDDLSRPGPIQSQPSSLHTDSSDSRRLSQEKQEAAIDAELLAGIQRQHSLRARGSAMLTSLLSRKTKDSRSKDTTLPRSSASSTHSRGASISDVPIHDDDEADGSSSPTKSDDRNGQANKLKRLLKSRRRSLPQDSTYIVSDSTPMPIDAEDKLREHGFKVVHAPLDAPTLRMEHSRDTLRTIISVGSGEEDNATDNQPPSNQHKSRFAKQKQAEPRQSHHRSSSINRTKSQLYPKPSSRQSRATLRKSLPVVIRPTTKSDPVDEDLAETVQIWGYEAHMASIASIRHMAGNSAFDQAFVPMSRDNGAYPAPATMSQPNQDRTIQKGRPGGRSNHPPLRTRYSAPDFLETVAETASPGDIDSSHQKLPKTPPPISLRTRGSKKSRRRSRSQHHSHRPNPHLMPPMAPMMPQSEQQDFGLDHEGDMPSPRRLSQSLRSFPVQPPQGPHTGPYHLQGGYPPTHDRMHFSKPRQHAHRGSWNGPHASQIRPQGPRAHHSYESTPAYRGHPIQSS